jgi:xanthine dehydrogenase YagS FAD-binding subunit
MAVIHDVMPAFLLLQPGSLADAQKLLEREGADGWILAGGLDSFDWLKDRMRKPNAVIDLSGVQELKGSTQCGGRDRDRCDDHADGSCEPPTHSAEVPTPRPSRLKPWLHRKSVTRPPSAGMSRRTPAAGITAPAGRATGPGGNICYADTQTGAIASTPFSMLSGCVAVNPSDTAPALIALDARFVLQTPQGERVISAEDYFVGPDVDITRLTILRPGDLLSSIRIPSTWAGAQFYFEKIRDRQVWDFPLLNVASAMTLSGRSYRAHPDCRECRRRASVAVGVGRTGGDWQAAERRDGEMAGNLAVQGAVPLQFNGYKVPLMRNLVKRAISGGQEATWTSYSGQ